MQRVFISHCYADRAFCRDLARVLRAAGLDVWYDQYPPDSGTPVSAIQRQIRLRPAFVALLSPAALRSPRMREECALGCGLSAREPGRLVIPVVVEAIAAAQLWPFLAGRERIEAAEHLPHRRAEAIQQTMRALTHPPAANRDTAQRQSADSANNLDLPDPAPTPEPRDRVLSQSVPRPAGPRAALRQAQTLHEQGRTDEAIALCEELTAGETARPEVRYFLGWLYQEADRWAEASAQFALLLGDAEYALSCYYALGQCARARGELDQAARYFDEAVDRVNLEMLERDQCGQLLQLCEEAAEAHRDLGDQRGAEVIYEALLRFLQGRGWRDEAATAERAKRQALAPDRQ